MEKIILENYKIAKMMYETIGVDTDEVLERVKKIPVSMHCWQGDDVMGFEGAGELTGGIQTTGNYPGKARNGEELRCDMEKALSLIPGTHKVNIHASYAEFDGNKADRDQLTPAHFKKWVAWAKKNGIGLDFNETYFSHPKSESGLTLSSGDEEIRRFWVEHGKRCRKIGEYFGRELGQTCVTNLWIPDGYKDITVDKLGPRMRLKKSLDEVFAEKIDSAYNIDSVESKVFGIGSESYVVGSHEFYMGYAAQHDDVMLTLDAGHFHPTEMISGKISSIFTFKDKLLLHVSRPVRWDSDHVVIFDDELCAIMQELNRNDLFGKTYIALDFFDASINRIAAWVIGMRNTIKAMIFAMLEPVETLKKAEAEGDFTSRLALLEEYKSYPFSAVWNYYCQAMDVPVKESWLNEVRTYERDVLAKRV